MLQDYRLIRHYQVLIDAMVDLWQRGYRSDDFRLVLDGYLMSLRTQGDLETFELRRIGEEVERFYLDPSNFSETQTELETMPRRWRR